MAESGPASGASFTGVTVQDAREQTLRTAVDHVLVKNLDYRDLFTTRTTFLSPALAAIYKLPPRVRDPLLEGMRERGPAAYQEVIDTYFRHLGRDLPP